MAQPPSNLPVAEQPSVAKKKRASSQADAVWKDAKLRHAAIFGDMSGLDEDWRAYVEEIQAETYLLLEEKMKESYSNGRRMRWASGHRGNAKSA